MLNFINFEQISWASQAQGVREKRIEQENQVMRLLEFSYGFTEEEWYTKGHIGYVIEGSFSINFDGNHIHYKQGDGIWINEGKKNKHKAILKEGESVLLVLFENIENRPNDPNILTSSSQ